MRFLEILSWAVGEDLLRSDLAAYLERLARDGTYLPGKERRENNQELIS